MDLLTLEAHSMRPYGGPHNEGLATAESAIHEPDTHTNARPTRRYQALLLATGFLMTFQVIGINSIFGIFQVHILIPPFAVMKYALTVLLSRNSTLLLRQISRMLPIKMLLYRSLVPLAPDSHGAGAYLSIL